MTDTKSWKIEITTPDGRVVNVRIDAMLAELSGAGLAAFIANEVRRAVSELPLLEKAHAND